MDSNPNVENKSSLLSILLRLAVAVLLGLGITLFLGVTAWSKVPYSDAEMKALETSDEAKIRDLRNQEVKELRITLGRRPPAHRRADLYFRLAEIYMEAYHATYVLEGRVHEKRLAANREDKFIDHHFSRPYLMFGIKACNEVLGLKIPYGKLDEIYYFLAFYYSELGNKKESAKHYEHIIKHYPNSAFIGEAYREIGDASYDETHYRKAIEYYESATHKANPDTLPRIYHKLAWSFYRTKSFNRAVDSMRTAIDLASKNGEKFLSLREEALRDMAIFMTETGRVEEAISYFQTVVPDKTFYPKILEKLGKQYERNVEPAKATQVYESLLKTNPDSEEAFRVLVKLVDLDLRRGKFNEALARLKDLKFPRNEKAQESDTQTAAQNLRAMVRRTATEHHESYRKKGDRGALEIADAYYSAYLNKFLAQDDPRSETPEIEMYLAEIKRDEGKSKEASALYRKVLESHDKRYAKEAGALWTASLAEAMKKAPNKSDEPSEIEKQFVEAADQLQQNLGETPEAREAALQSAQVLAGYKSTRKEAIKRIRRIIDQWPKSPQALTAARLWLQIYTDQLPASGVSGVNSDVLDSLKEAQDYMRSNQSLMAADEANGKKLHVQFADLASRLKIGRIAKEEHDQDFSGAGKDYENFAREAGQGDIAEKAYANAVSSYLKSGDTSSLERVTAEWLKRFPKDAKAIESIRSAATGVLIQGDFEAAAKLFERVGQEGGDADSFATAAKLYEGDGDIERAQKVWSSYLTLYSNGKDKWKVARALARSEEAEHKDSQANKSYKFCMSGPPEFEAECGARLVDLYLRNKNLVDAKALLKKLSASGAKSTSPYVSYARFRQAQLLEEEAQFEPLKLPEAQLKKALNQRLEFLEPLSRAYMTSVEAGGPWGIAALNRLANWALKFADEVDHIAPPPTASAAGVVQFKKNLASVSDPLRRKAIATWSDAYHKAVEREIFSPALPELADNLADFKATHPGRAQGFHGNFRLAGMPADGGDEGRSDALKKVRERLTKNAQDSKSWSDYGNLIWGMKKPLLAKIAYERALSLNRKNLEALNNEAVVLISSEGEEDWHIVGTASQLFHEALRDDEFFMPAKMNMAALLNYYRLFSKAKGFWDQILVKNSSADAQDGLAISLQGLGNLTSSEDIFKTGTDQGGSKSRFANVYHEAARLAASGTGEGAEKCLSRIDDLDYGKLVGFEKIAVDHLKRTCNQWKPRRN